MRYTLAIITIISLSIVLAACRMDHPDPIIKIPTHSIRLNIAHEFEHIEEDNEPLAVIKGSSNDLYGVQIYKDGPIDFVKYAYGIFDDPSLISIDLEAGEYYKIEMTMVPNGTTIISKDQTGGYQEPFVIKGFGGANGKITNKFITSTNVSMENIRSGYAVITQPNTGPIGYDIPPISRFYGITDEFQPTENMTLTINLNWVVFGLTIVPRNFNEGSIEIKMTGAPILTIKSEDPNTITKKIFTFNHSLPETSEWCDDKYSENIPTDITWIKSDGSKVILLQAVNPINIERRTNKVLYIQCGEGEANPIVISKENTELIYDHSEVISKES